MSLEQNGYNKGGLIAFMFSVVVTLLFFVYVSFFSGGVDLKELPENIAAELQQAETDATQAPQAVQDVDVTKIENPWMESDDLIAHGKKLYQTNCTMCHGASGMGDGPAGQALKPPPRNLVAGNWKVGGTRLGLFKVLQEGIPNSSMQGYAHLSAADRWSLVHFIRSITKNKVSDSDDEVAQKAPSLK